MNKDTALVIFSGGQDSTTCLFWAKREFKKSVCIEFSLRSETSEGSGTGA